MKLDRNTNPQGIGKYALIKLRDVPVGWPKFTEDSQNNEFVTVPSSCVDFGGTADSDFFVVRLKDKYAYGALLAYAEAAEKDDKEYASEVYKLATIAREHPNKRKPD